MNPPRNRRCLDATRTHDGAPSMLKFVESWSEVHITSILGKIDDPYNHTIPVYDVFPLPDDHNTRILVTPRMSDADEPPFSTVAEVVDFLRQIFEGVEFMHRQNVAHYDITMGNIVLDSTQLIPGGFHPVFPSTQDGRSKPTVVLTRTEVAPVQYYFIDFGLAVMFDSVKKREKVMGICGQHKNIPELSENVPYDPFKLDMRQIGETIKEEFLDKYWGLEFLIPLTKVLRRYNPNQRPHAAEALRRFMKLVATIDDSSGATRLVAREGFQPVHRLTRAIFSLSRGLRL